MILPHALAYARKGWRVLPVWWPEPDGCACPADGCSSPGKHPLARNGAHDGTTDEQQIRAWWNRCPDANLAIATGNDSGIWVLDVDSGKGGLKSLQRLLRDHPMPDPTVWSETGSGGRHVLWRTWGEPVPNSVNLYPGIDLRGDGGLIVAPPSIHATGAVYAWGSTGRPGKVKVQPTPGWLRAIVTGAKAGKPRRQYRGPSDRPKPRIDLDSVREMAEGERNAALFRLVGRIIWEERTESEVEQAAHQVNRAKCRPPLPDREVDKLVRSAWRRYS
jgi:hypothetical protein